MSDPAADGRTPRARLPFVDWMKAVGMLLVVAGHVAAGHLNLLTPPIYPKQWGVAFFVFIAGYGLTLERRPRREVVAGRLFELLAIGLAFALLSSAMSLAMGGRGLLSNYWPFLLGANVVFNAFPANPTTWYIGTYIHLVLLWAAVGRRVVPDARTLAAVALVEIGARMVAWAYAGEYVAYMLVPNWATCYLLGAFAATRVGAVPPPAWSAGVAGGVLIGLVTLGARVDFDRSFPFRLPQGLGVAGLAWTSVGVTAIYASATWLAYAVATRLPAHRLVNVCARQTVFVFVAHMPVLFLLQPYLAGWPRGWRALTYLLVCFGVMVVCGELVHRLLPLRDLKQRFVSFCRDKSPRPAPVPAD
jgi:peptidoglycan/LPS O-acetylase OafA/YrhL